MFDTYVKIGTIAKLDRCDKNDLHRPVNTGKRGGDMVGVRQFEENEALEKALVLFWQKGFAETSMQELAAATGVQRGSLYNAYKGKETFFLRVFDVYKDRFLSQLRHTLDKPKLRDALRSFLGTVIDSMTTGKPTRGCLTTKSAFGSSVIDPRIQQALQGLLDAFEMLLLDRLQKGEKGVRLMCPPEEAARLIVTFTRGLVVIERVYQDKARMLATADSLIALLVEAPAPVR
jgi:TetR/AcrR family transcriptional repressor of nem operon